ncbi:MAG: hypothetical protein ACI9EF_001578 [Pseudohongiellaceae bacterium]|jgi:hypothetical protein
MTFSTYRKYQTPLLIAAVVFTVAVFVFFPSFGAMDDLAQGGDPNSVFGRFRLHGGGETVDVTQWEFSQAHQDMGRFLGSFNGLEDEQVWQSLMLAADARAAGLRVSDADLVSFFRNAGLDDVMYETIWRSKNFDSAKSFEAFVAEFLLVQQWTDVLMREASIVSADEVYLGWRVDHELFDLEAMVFADAEPESIADPGDEALSAYFDETPEYLRDRRFVDPAQYGVAYAWLPLDMDVSDLPAEFMDVLPEVTDDNVEVRWQQLKSTRFPELESADEETLAALRNELVVMNLVAAANKAWTALSDAPQEGPMPSDDDTVNPAVIQLSKVAFLELMESYGLMTADPDGLLDPDGLTDLDEIGSALLSAQLTSVEAGDSRYFQPFGQDTEAHIVFVEETVAAVPLDFAGARDAVLDQWRKESAQLSGRADAYRQALTEAARDLPEAQELLTPLIDSAASAAETRITLAALENDGEPLDEAAQQLIHDEELAAVQSAMDNRLAEFAARFWDEQSAAAVTAAPELVNRLTMAAVPRNYRQSVDDEEEAFDSVERFLKTNGTVFQQEVDGVTGVLRHGVGNQTVVVRVTGRRFPPLADMLADAEGMEQSRQQLGYSNMMNFQIMFSPDRFTAPFSTENPFGHELMLVQQVVVPVEVGPDGVAGEDADS